MLELRRRPRTPPRRTQPIERIIADAVRTASNYLVPAGLPAHVWRSLTPTEKLYLKGLDVERHGDFRAGAYQEFALGFGVQDYAHLLHTALESPDVSSNLVRIGRRNGELRAVDYSIEELETAAEQNIEVR